MHIISTNYTKYSFERREKNKVERYKQHGGKTQEKKAAHRFFEHVHYFRQKFIIGINLLIFIAFLKDAATTKKHKPCT